MRTGGKGYSRRTVLIAPAAALLIAALPGATGTIALGDGAVAYVPASATQGAPVLILLHGAGGRPEMLLRHFQRLADAHGMVLLGPKSAGPSWALIRTVIAQGETLGGRMRPRQPDPGIDPERIETALRRLGERIGVDPARTALAGFSDGASVALSLGPRRPDLYRVLIGFSPGLISLPSGTRGGQPAFVSHGRVDSVLAFENTERWIVPELRRHGHAVTFRPFEGDHTVPALVAAEAIAFFLAAGAGSVRGS